MKRISFNNTAYALVILTSLYTHSVIAQTKTAAPAAKPAATAAPADQDSMDLKKLEQKYWESKETELSVVQNRVYSKTGRYFINATYGILINDPYSNGQMTNVSLGYYFNEKMGMEIAHEMGRLEDNDSVTRYRNQYAVEADYNRFKTYTSANFLLVPFYAKMNFMDYTILYFDMQFAFGLGQMNYDSRTNRGDRSDQAIGFNFDVSQHFYFHENWAFRVDLKNKFSKQNRYRYQLSGAQTESQRELPSVNQQDTTVLMGLTFLY